MRGINKDDYVNYFYCSLKGETQTSRLSGYKNTKKAFHLRFREENTDENILCELGKLNQANLLVRGFVEKIKNLTRKPQRDLMIWWLTHSSMS